MSGSSLSPKYLAREVVLVLGLSYALWLGGTYNGLIFHSFRRASLVGLAMTGAEYAFLRWRSGRPSAEKLRVPLLGLLLAFAVATAASSDPRRSLIALWQVGLAVWVFWLASDLLAGGWPAELWVKSLLAGGSIVLVLGVLTIGGWYQSWLDIGGLARPVPPVILRVWTLPGHPNFVAGALNLLWPLALARLLGSKSRLTWGVLGIWVAVAWFILFFTSSRGGWLAAAAAFAILLALWVLDRGGLAWLKSGWGWLQHRPVLLWGGSLLLAVVITGVGMVAWKQLSHPSHGSLLTSRSEFWPPAWAAFLREPAVGIGPFTFLGEFNRTNSVPPIGIYTHAHSIPLNTLAECGVVGLAALVGAVGAAGWGLVRAWRAAKPGHRVELIGAIAALTTVAVHGFFDTVEMMPTLAMLAAIVGAIGLHRSGERPRGRGWAALALWALLVGTGAWSVWGNGPASAGVLAGNMGDWKAAVPLLEKAVERDPALALNQFHAGYAHGVLAVEDAAHLEPAIAHYRAGMLHDPDYAPHHANLAALLWAAGEKEDAVSEMTKAAELAPRSAIFQLNLGSYLEELGQEVEGIAAYVMAIELGRWEAVQFWESTSVRAEALARVTATATPVEDEGWGALEDGRLAQARDEFEGQLSKQPNLIAAYRGLAAVALAEGDLGMATHNLQVALFIGSTYSPEEYIRAQMDWARLAAAEGDLPEAVMRAEPVLDAFRRQTFWGVGRFGTADYGWYVYYRESLLADMLPQVLTIRMPDEAAEWTLEVAEWQHQLGHDSEAQTLCQDVLGEIPDNEAARACVDGLAD